jgi:acetyltransferase-like isoleucine patch superfamily enzyme
MAVLIGRGAHGSDIADTLDMRVWDWYTDHRDYHGPGPAIIAINNCQTRAKAAADLGLQDLAWVHPDAHLYHDVTYGYGTHINYNSYMVRTQIGNHCTIAPGVTIAGDVRVGDRVFVGINASIGNLVTIGDDAIIGAGSVVLKDVPAGRKSSGCGRENRATRDDLLGFLVPVRQRHLGTRNACHSRPVPHPRLDVRRHRRVDRPGHTLGL